MDYFKFAKSDLKVARFLFKGESTDRDDYDKIISSYSECMEKYVKGLLHLELGEEIKTHNSWLLVSKLIDYSSLYVSLRNYRGLIKELQCAYFERRYPSKDYCALTKVDFLDIVKESDELISVLEKLRIDKGFQTNILGDSSVF